jgi:hypothetical protein
VLGDIADVVALNANDEKELVGKVEDAISCRASPSVISLSGGDICLSLPLILSHSRSSGVRPSTKLSLFDIGETVK